MKTLDKIKTIGLSLVFITVVLAGCKKEVLPDTSTQSSVSSAASQSNKAIPFPSGGLTIHMINTSPMARIYAELNVEITKVEVLYENREQWLPLKVAPKVYDLLHLDNTDLADNVVLPAGHIVKLRLSFGPRNSIVIFNGISRSFFHLAVPYSTTEVNISTMVSPNLPTSVTINFKANASVSNEGDGIYILYPIITPGKIVPVPTDVPTL